MEEKISMKYTFKQTQWISSNYIFTDKIVCNVILAQEFNNFLKYTILKIYEEE